MELFWTGRQIHQEVQVGGGGGWGVEEGNATISADMTRGGWMEAGQRWAINFSLGGTWGGVALETCSRGWKRGQR